MKLRLLEFLACPACRASMDIEHAALETIEDRFPWEGNPCAGLCPFSRLKATERDCATCVRLEVVSGRLRCCGCGAEYRVEQGIPRLLLDRGRATVSSSERLACRTAASYGFLWSRGRPEAPVDNVERYHFEKVERSVPFHVKGLVLDAGCGEGSDLAGMACRPSVEVIGVELSEGGARASFRRTLRHPNAHVVQSDLRRLPFASERFDRVYSYGVLHHLPNPEDGLQDLVRVLTGTGVFAAYVYEDFSERPRFWRWLLRAVNQLRWFTTRLPYQLLYAVCRVLSPVMFLLFVLPHRAFWALGIRHPLVAAIPFRHAAGPMSLTGDLFDRFSTPVEWRYSRTCVERLMSLAGLSEIAVTWERGWMALGVKAGTYKQRIGEKS